MLYDKDPPLTNLNSLFNLLEYQYSPSKIGYDKNTNRIGVTGNGKYYLSFS